MTPIFKLFQVSLSFLLISCAAQNEAAVNQSSCRVLIENEAGNIEHIDAPTVDLSQGDKFTLPENLVGASTIICDRPNLVVNVNDFLVVRYADKPVMLFAEEAKIVLEMVNGQFRLRVIDGSLNEEQLSLMQKTMNEAQLVVQEK